MFEYEKIELDHKLPIKLIDIYFENHQTKTAIKVKIRLPKLLQISGYTLH